MLDRLPCPKAGFAALRDGSRSADVRPVGGTVRGFRPGRQGPVGSRLRGARGPGEVPIFRVELRLNAGMGTFGGSVIGHRVLGRSVPVRRDHIAPGCARLARPARLREGAPGIGWSRGELIQDQAEAQPSQRQQEAGRRQPTGPVSRARRRRRLQAPLDHLQVLGGEAGARLPAQLVGQQGGGGAGLGDGQAALGAFGDLGLDRGGLGLVQFAQRVGGQAGIVRVVGHGDPPFISCDVQDWVSAATGGLIRLRMVLRPVWIRKPTLETVWPLIRLISL